MPLVVEDHLPAKLDLKKESVYFIDKIRAAKQDIRPIHIAILNLMPNKSETETQLLRALSHTPLQVHVDFIRTGSYEPTHTDQDHLKSFYRDFADIRQEKYDGMIITGAPVEHLDFEEVLYWEELKEIFDYARTNVFSTMFICWASQAALYYYYGIPKHPAPKKIFGVYEYEILEATPLTRGLDDTFYSPQSRHTYNKVEDVSNHPDLKVISYRPDTGVSLATSLDHRFVFTSGHNEYDKTTLDREYRRDLAKGLPIEAPINYFRGDDPAQGIVMKWRSHSSLLFSNWINYCIYESTPFQIESIGEKKVAKFGGSSLCDSAQFLKVRDIVASDPGRRIVVVSAPGRRFTGDIKITDLLHAWFFCQDLNEKENIREIIEQRYAKIVNTLELTPGLLEEIDSTLEAASASTDLDFVLSRGEYLSARILARYLGFGFLDAAQLVFFKEDGSVDPDRTRQAIQTQIREADHFVVPGFYGSGPDGQVRIFQRGGSDITGSLIAGALQASVYENWTDVDGLMNKDPNQHPDAALIKSMSYEDFFRISQQGDQLFHRDAIGPIMAENIPLNIRNTNTPQNQGTTIN